MYNNTGHGTRFDNNYLKLISSPFLSRKNNEFILNFDEKLFSNYI